MIHIAGLTKEKRWQEKNICHCYESCNKATDYQDVKHTDLILDVNKYSNRRSMITKKCTQEATELYIYHTQSSSFLWSLAVNASLSKRQIPHSCNRYVYFITGHIVAKGSLPLIIFGMLKKTAMYIIFIQCVCKE